MTSETAYKREIESWRNALHDECANSYRLAMMLACATAALEDIAAQKDGPYSNASDVAEAALAENRGYAATHPSVRLVPGQEPEKDGAL